MGAPLWGEVRKGVGGVMLGEPLHYSPLDMVRGLEPCADTPTKSHESNHNTHIPSAVSLSLGEPHLGLKVPDGPGGMFSK